MLKMLNRYRNDLGVKALPREMDDADETNRFVGYYNAMSTESALKLTEVKGRLE